MEFRRSLWRGRCIHDSDRNRDLSPWLPSRGLVLWLDAFDTGLVYGWEIGGHEVAEEVANQVQGERELERELKDETT